MSLCLALTVKLWQPSSNRRAGQGGFLGFLNLLSGGTIPNFSLLSMGVYPYITAQIILQLLIPIIPALQRRMQEDQREGRRWMEKWTYYLAVPMAILSAIGQINIFNSLSMQALGQPIIQFSFHRVNSGFLHSWFCWS